MPFVNGIDRHAKLLEIADEGIDVLLNIARRTVGMCRHAHH